MELDTIARRVAQRTPSSVTSTLRGTPIESLYYWYYYQTVSKAQRRYETSCGSFSTTTPQYSWSNTEKKGDHTGENPEPKITNELCEIIDSDTVFYDIGGRFGYYALLAHHCGSQKVHSFDAYPLHYYFLKRNCGKYDIKTIKSRVGSNNSKNVVTIDTYSHKNSVPDIIKIDVEGAEWEVIQGMDKLLTNHSPKVYIEIHPDMISINVAEIISNLEKYDYDLSVTDHRSSDAKWEDFDKDKYNEFETFALRLS